MGSNAKLMPIATGAEVWDFVIDIIRTVDNISTIMLFFTAVVVMSFVLLDIIRT